MDDGNQEDERIAIIIITTIIYLQNPVEISEELATGLAPCFTHIAFS